MFLRSAALVTQHFSDLTEGTKQIWDWNWMQSSCQILGLLLIFSGQQAESSNDMHAQAQPMTCLKQSIVVWWHKPFKAVLSIHTTMNNKWNMGSRPMGAMFSKVSIRNKLCIQNSPEQHYYEQDFIWINYSYIPATLWVTQAFVSCTVDSITSYAAAVIEKRILSLS